MPDFIRGIEPLPDFIRGIKALPADAAAGFLRGIETLPDFTRGIEALPAAAAGFIRGIASAQAKKLSKDHKPQDLNK